MTLTHVQLQDAIRRFETTDGLPIVELPAGIFDIRDSLQLAAHGIGFRGKGPDRTILRNVSETGAHTFRVKEVSGPTVQNFRLEQLSIVNEEGAGRVIDFDLHSGAGRWYWRDMFIDQQNPNAEIIRASFLKSGDVAHGDGGMFFCTFQDQFWEHANRNNPPTVPAMDIDGDFPAFNANRFERFRADCNEGAEFVRLLNNAPEAVRYWSANHFSDWVFEIARGGLFHFGGLISSVIERTSVYDSELIDGHLIHLREGIVQECDLVVVRDYFRPGTQVPMVGVAGTNKSATYTSAGTTITATYGAAHGYVVGQPLYIEGAGLDSQRVVVASAPGLDITFEATGSLPASGSLTSYEAACDIKLGNGSTRTVLEGIGGNQVGDIFVDCNNRGVEIRGKNLRASFYRVSTLSTVVTGMGSGGDAAVEGDVGRFNELEGRDGGELTFANAIQAEGGVRFGGEDTILAVRTAFATLDFPSIPAHSTADLNVTVTGIAVNDRVIIEPRGGALEAGLIAWGFCSSTADTVTIRLANVTTAAIDPASRTWDVTVFSH